MLVDVVQLRADGMKLTREEIAAARTVRGNLTISGGQAYLHLGTNEAIGQLLIPLSEARVTRMRDDGFVIVGQQWRDQWISGDPWPQAWWCRVVRPTIEPER